MYAVGIDLGTTNSVVSVFRKGRKETLMIDGRSFVPSVVSFRPNQPPLVGQTAKNRMEVDPENTVASAKRFMGDRTKAYQILGQSYSPVDIAAKVLAYLIEGAKATLKQDIWDAVITVPAYFNDEQRADTKRAGEQAGLNVLRLLPEPSAAAISYGFLRNKDQTILVYDLGGGTFDISILKVQGNDFQVLAVGGDSKLGGDDFDNALVHWAAKQFEGKFGTNVLKESGREFAKARQRLKEEAEKAKKELSESDSAEFLIPEIAGHSLELEIHINEFNQLIKPYLDKTIKCLHQVLNETKLSPEDIDRIVLVGGSTHVRAVRDLVAREIKEPFCDESAHESIAWGAGIIAASLGTPDRDQTPMPIVREATAFSLGIGVYDSKDNYNFQPLITRNSKYPCEGAFMGFTSGPFQKHVRIRVFRGEDPDPMENDELGELTVPVKIPQKEQVPVAAVFKLDQDGILHFQAVDVPIGPGADGQIIRLVEGAMNNEGAIDIGLLESLIEGKKVSEPEKITLDPQ